MLLLPQLPNLRHLSVSGGHAFMTPERHLHALQLLPNLQSLTLSVASDGNWNEHTLEPLRHLRALTSLSLTILYMFGPLLVSPALAQLTQLQALRLECQSDEGRQGVANDDICHDRLMRTVSKLTGLEALVLEDMVDRIPAELERLVHLTQLGLSILSFDDPDLAILPTFGMCTKLKHIRLSELDNASDEAWRLVCRALQLLPQLETLDVSYVDLSEVQPSSWALPLSLRSLTLSDCSMRTIPGAVCCLLHLQHLCLTRSPGWNVQLESFSKGPYLFSLQYLEISEPKSGAGPEALTDAMHLRSLTLTFRQNVQSLWTSSALQPLLPKGCAIILEHG